MEGLGQLQMVVVVVTFGFSVLGYIWVPSNIWTTFEIFLHFLITFVILEF